MSNTVNVVDSIMGSGKTTAMIRYINESSPDRRFIFCTPYLEQVERIRANCIGRNFVEPSDKAVTKLTSIKLLLRRRQNIATTHALFMLLDNEARELISEGKYTLIVDEAMDIFGMLDIAPLDSELLCEHLCSEDESGPTALGGSGLLWSLRFVPGRDRVGSHLSLWPCHPDPHGEYRHLRGV